MSNNINIKDIPVSSPSSRRIVLLGKTGVGKSAVGNTILGQKEFRSKRSLKSVTSECSVKHATVSGRSVSVVDTPGFFDTQMKPEELVKEIARSVYLSSPGPHAFLIVFRVDDRFTEQELEIPQQIKKLFGEEVLKYSIILFTRGDLLEEEADEVIEESPALKDLVGQCGGRFHVFNNRDENNRQQVNDLLQTIDTMVEQNGGGHYSNQMYEDAERLRLEEEEQRLREEEERKLGIKADEDPLKNGFLLFLSQYKHHIYIAAVAAGCVFGGAVGGTVVYGAVGGGAVGGAVVGGVSSGTLTGAAVGAFGGAAVGGAAVVAVAGGAVGFTAAAKAVGVGAVGGALVGGAESWTFKGALAGAAVGAATVGGAAVGAATVGGAAFVYTAGGAVAGGAVSGGVVGAVVGVAESGTVKGALVGAAVGAATVGGAAVGGAVVGGAAGYAVRGAVVGGAAGVKHLSEALHDGGATELQMKVAVAGVSVTAKLVKLYQQHRPTSNW